MSGLASQADPQYVEILEREKLLQQRLRLRSTFAVTGDGETREAPLIVGLRFVAALLVRFLAGLTKLAYEMKQNRS